MSPFLIILYTKSYQSVLFTILYIQDILTSIHFQYIVIFILFVKIYHLSVLTILHFYIFIMNVPLQYHHITHVFIYNFTTLHYYLLSLLDMPIPYYRFMFIILTQTILCMTPISIAFEILDAELFASYIQKTGDWPLLSYFLLYFVQC